jgi:hypothetical protein
MKQRCSSSLNSIAIALLIAIAAMTANPAQSIAASTFLAPIPLSSAIQLNNMTYTYDPSTQTLTKTYELQNISGGILTNPRLVNLFLWSNNLCSAPAAAWATMAYDGINFSNADQTAKALNNTGTMDWSADVYPASFASTQLFPLITPVQSVQSGVSYPYWDASGLSSIGGTATITVKFSNVLNCSLIQNVVWVIYEGSAPTSTTTTAVSSTTTTISTTTTTQIPTVIELSNFSAIPGDGEVTLMWRTESEIDTAGFNIYRGVIGSSEMTKLNDTLIPAKGTATSGAEYTYVDNDVKNGVIYIYKLEDVDTAGTVTEHKPVRATPRWIYSLFHQN